ncbi:MAG: hypothetical protein NW217_08435 [Hyphomicrobiaceae bacterium]|nr:hypothetical protein [Hyphomicrobiaceae bacterium]
MRNMSGAASVMGRLVNRLKARHIGLLVGSVALVASLVAILTATSEAMLRSQFATAAANTDQSGGLDQGGRTVARHPVVSGSESYWLGDARNAGLTPVALRGPLTVGDRITIDGVAGKRELEVVALADVPASMTRMIEGDVSRGLVMVTCRAVGDDSPAVVRFIIEPGPAASAALAPARVKTAQSL